MPGPGYDNYRLQFEISPIYLTGGIAGNVPGATVPLLYYTEGTLFNSFLEAGLNRSLDDFFAHFVVEPGSSLVSNEIGEYPFANQSVAANAIIFTPLTLSVMMKCPAQNEGDYWRRGAIISSLKATLDAHNLAGGTYSVATPAYLYTDLLLLRMADASSGETKQTQYQYRWDFRRPLISQQEANQSYSNLLAKINSQTQLTPNASGNIPWSSAGNTTGDPASGAASAIVPSNSPDPGLGFAPTGTNDTTGSGVAGFADTPATAAPSPAANPPPPPDAGVSGINIPFA